MQSQPFATRSSSGGVVRSSRGVVPAVALLAFGLAACAAAGAMASTGLIGLDILRKTFDHATAKNYGEAYKDNADDLFKALSKPSPEKSSDGAAPEPHALASADPVAAPPPATESPAPPAASSTVAPAADPTGHDDPKAPLALEVGIFKEVVSGDRSIPVPLQDGEILYDAYGTHGSGDEIKFMFRANADAYVYVISIDGTGWIQPIFPGAYSSSGNPVRAHQTYLFPEGSTWAPLDSYRGVEHLYFLAARSPRPDLEKSLAAFADRTRGLDPARKRMEGSSPESPALAQVSSDAPLTRGFDAPRPSKVQSLPSSAGERFPVDTQLFVSNGSGEIVVTRWFRHE